MTYEERRAKAFRALRVYLIGISIFIVINFVVIFAIPGYSFPKNFFAIWPILGWGVPTLWRLFELRRFRDTDE